MEQENGVFGSDASHGKGEKLQENSAISNSEISSGFTKYTPERMIPDPTQSVFYQMRQGTPDHITGSDRKRGRRAMHDENSIDEILGQLTSKLNTLSTNEDEKKTECTKAFIEVLGCSNTEATFYLESSAWNLEAAVVLWLESNTMSSGGSGGPSSRYSYNDQPRPVMNMPLMPFNSLNSSLNPSHQSGLYGGLHRRYEPRDVPIHDLPVDWKAVVNAGNGTVQFVHIPTGVRQNNVPPGYADAVEESDGEEMGGRDIWGEDGVRLGHRSKNKCSRGYRVKRNDSGGVLVDMSGDADDTGDSEDDEGMSRSSDKMGGEGGDDDDDDDDEGEGRECGYDEEDISSDGGGGDGGKTAHNRHRGRRGSRGRGPPSWRNRCSDDVRGAVVESVRQSDREVRDSTVNGQRAETDSLASGGGSGNFVQNLPQQGQQHYFEGGVADIDSSDI